MQNLQTLILTPPTSPDAAMDLFRDGNFLMVALSPSPLIAEITSTADGSLSVVNLTEGQSLSIPGGFKYVRLRLDKALSTQWSNSPIHLMIGDGDAKASFPLDAPVRTLTRTIPHIARTTNGNVHTFSEEPGTSSFYLHSEKIPTISTVKVLCIALPNRNAIRRKVSLLHGVSASKISATPQISKNIPIKWGFALDQHDLCAVYVGTSAALVATKDSSRSTIMRSVTSRTFHSDNLGVSEDIYSPAAGAYKRGDAAIFEGGGPLFMAIDGDYTADAALYIKVEETFRVNGASLSSNIYQTDVETSNLARSEPNAWTMTI